MFFDNLDLLNKYDNNKKVYLIAISSSEMTEFNIYYHYIVRRLNDLKDNELKDYFSKSLKVLFNSLKSTIQPYEKILEEFDLNELGNFFSRLVNADYEEKTLEILKKLANLIKKFKNGEVSNRMYEKYVEYHTLYGGNSVVISYYIPNNEDVIYSSVYKYFRGDKFYDNAFFLGTPNYYGDITIFKSSRTFYLGYDMYSMKLSTKTILKDNADENSSIYRDIDIIYLSDRSTELPKTVIEETRFEPNSYRIDISDLKKKYVRDIDYQMSCDGNLVAFSSGNYIFYTTNSKLNVINKENGFVEKKELKEINQADWIIIRTASDEEYLEEESKREIGEAYDFYYLEVTNYKKMLQDKIDNEYFSLERLNGKLKKENINVPINLLKQWVFGDTIAPMEENYYKLLNFLGYSKSEIEIIYGYYKKIRSSRMRAGRRLSGIFQSIVKNIGIDRIREEMYRNSAFEFSNNFGEFRIEEIVYVDNEITNIEMSDLYKLRAVNSIEKEKYNNDYFD